MILQILSVYYPIELNHKVCENIILGLLQMRRQEEGIHSMALRSGNVCLHSLNNEWHLKVVYFHGADDAPSTIVIKLPKEYGHEADIFNFKSRLILLCMVPLPVATDSNCLCMLISGFSLKLSAKFIHHHQTRKLLPWLKPVQIKLPLHKTMFITSASISLFRPNQCEYEYNVGKINDKVAVNLTKLNESLTAAIAWDLKAAAYDFIMTDVGCFNLVFIGSSPYIIYTSHGWTLMQCHATIVKWCLVYPSTNKILKEKDSDMISTCNLFLCLAIRISLVSILSQIFFCFLFLFVTGRFRCYESKQKTIVKFEQTENTRNCCYSILWSWKHCRVAWSCHLDAKDFSSAAVCQRNLWSWELWQ